MALNIYWTAPQGVKDLIQPVHISLTLCQNKSVVDKFQDFGDYSTIYVLKVNDEY